MWKMERTQLKIGFGAYKIMENLLTHMGNTGSIESYGGGVHIGIGRIYTCRSLHGA